MNTRYSVAVLGLALALVTSAVPASAQSAPELTDAQMEAFLLKARIVSTKPIGIGTTGSVRATLTDGTLTHDAHIQIVDVFKAQHVTHRGTEFSFRDDWRYNVAAYRVDRMLDLRLVPVSVERKWNGSPGAFTWWVDDVMMDEGKRIAKQIVAPNYGCWAQQAEGLRMFDQLIENTDRNIGNTLIASTWRLWGIDHTRAFRRSDRPRNVSDLAHIDRQVLDRLIALDFATLKQAIGRYVDSSHIRSLLSRRDALVAHYRSLQTAAIIDRQDPAAGCNVVKADASAPKPGGSGG